MPCRLDTVDTGSRSASRMIATICSSVKRAFRIAPSESGASLSTYRWSENLGAGHPVHVGQLTETCLASVMVGFPTHSPSLALARLPTRARRQLVGVFL